MISRQGGNLPGVNRGGVQFAWGAAGAAALGHSAACLIVVDVLSFTTAVTIVAEAGTRVFPYPLGDDSAMEFARQHAAELARGRHGVSRHSPWSLSPAALRRAPVTARLVLPSPNGSAISAAAAASGIVVVAACLRNAAAVARWLDGKGFGTARQPVAVVAAGECWPDGSLRPAVEDLLGAGAVIAVLHAQGRGPLSPEAEAARACFQATPDIASAVSASVSGRELADGGFAEDVSIATEINSSTTVPVLTCGAFTAEGNDGS
jgi:2-phosphosulfolactate phosphatase